MTRNGVIISVRTTPRPMNLRSSRSAKATPKIMATITAVTVMITECHSALRNAALVKTDL